ncbi:ATP-dependent RNA helicase RhlE [hydrothermal vent metagenome]|uniref:ATP-dependent RNA helicase RhlE n=1 Tax=hydrothermal vent metagenome TaxID=652676 RepID=A0A3B0SSN3_9ZZZZ
MTHMDAPSLDDSGFKAFGLADTILTAIDHEGFTTPTQIQTMAIPPLMEGRDLIGIAQTGGGKTAAFALPMINRLLEDYQKPRQNMPRVLILAPTRELAMQIEQCIVTFARGTKLRSLVIAGGQPYPPQTNKLRRGVDILVATPGRLIDHIGRKNVKFNDTGIFILDEADRMLDMGFIDDVRDIADSLPEQHQTILFSATMNPKVRNLTRALLNDPVNVEIRQKTAVADTIAHKLMNVSRKDKAKLLAEILSGDDVKKALVFARTKMGADELSKVLYEKGIRSDAIHGDKRQRVREKILLNFRRGRTRVLVATDVAARGIDVDGISHVVNYELPIEPENYIHRVGRTGRAGNSGIAISFCDPSDMRLLRPIESLIKQPIEVDVDHDYHIDMTARGKGKGGKGRFTRERGGFNNRGKSDRYKSRDRVKAANSDWNKEDRDVSRPARKKPAKTVRQERPARPAKPARKEAQRYDPWSAEARRYSDDPVLGKLIGKPPKIDSKKEDKSDFVKVNTKKKKSFKKNDPKPLERKKARGGKKALTAKRPEKALKSRNRPKDNGGNKAFSPKRKTLRPSRAA